MRTNKKLAIESLERREVFTAMPGVEGFDIYDAPLNVDDPVDTVQSMKHEFREHVQFCYQDGTDIIYSVDSPRDAASGLPTGKRTPRLDTANVDEVFTYQPAETVRSMIINSQTEMTHSTY